MLKLEDLAVDTFVSGLVPGAAAKVLYLKHAGADAVDVTFERLDGSVLKRTVFRSDEPSLTLESQSRVWSFDAKPASFKLAAEAVRIKLAHLFDPMMAVHTSDVDPLPHQVSAVYEAMLPKQPLRFVLADDPGAGKTVMAGLLIRELLLRGDLERCLIVAPGSLVEQWQAELANKFGLSFDLLSHALVDSTQSGNPFTEHPRLIAKLDQLTRTEEWHPKLFAAEWDLVIVDEAHKMAAHYKTGNELATTKRYDLGKQIGDPARTRNFLMMTATPHNGIEEDFQAWLALVDPDRFYGRARAKVDPNELRDVMRRMVKEDLLKFDKTRLFPDRFAYTLPFNLSPAEAALYQEVSDYVRHEMGSAEKLQGKKRGMVGFALTILQRRLASSPNAIYSSLRNRRERLEKRIETLRNPPPRPSGAALPVGRSWEASDFDDDIEDDATAEELERVQEELVNEATAAQTIPELMKEVEILKGLEKSALAIVTSKVDKKWDELSKVLQSKDPVLFLPNGRPRKILIFTEHRDTLTYLRKRIGDLLGEAAIVEIHGSTRREERLRAQEEFRQNPDVLVLLATDAAGEGVNLQVTNLMINYDLPWNPNRIEQRFGRIHRIGQQEACHLWNLVAIDTREGEVFHRLFAKLEEERKALGGKVFDILGESFSDRPLKEVLIQAIRYGESEEVRRKLLDKVDGALDTEHLKDIIARNALTAEIFDDSKLYRVREQMERAEAKKLQPFYLRRFVTESLERFGGELKEREKERYEIRHVPAEVRKKHQSGGGRRPVLEKYERVTFEREKMRIRDKPVADLVHPSHPLMRALIQLSLEEDGKALDVGTVFVDPTDPTTVPRLLFMLEHTVLEGMGTTRPASQRMVFVEIDKHGNVRNGGSAPYLSYDAPWPEYRPVVEAALAEPWLATDVSQIALTWASAHLVKEHFEEVSAQRLGITKKTLEAVHERLTREITFWSKRENELKAQVKLGKQPQMQPENARKRVEDLKSRLSARTKELEGQRVLASQPPIVKGCALVLPQGMFDAADGKPQSPEADADVRRQVEQRAMRAVMEAEIALGYRPRSVAGEKCGWDITSDNADGTVVRHIEVKGRHIDADTVCVTANEVLEALNQGDKFILAIVRVDGDRTEGPFYVRKPFEKELEGSTVSVNHAIAKLMARAKSPGEA